MHEALVIAGLAIGAIAALIRSGDAGAAAPSGTAAVSGDGARLGHADSGARNLDRTEPRADGHFYAGVTVGSVVDLTGGDARGWAPLACGRARYGEAGASGPIRDVALTLDRVSLGKHEARGVRAVMIPEGLPVSLVAQSFLTTVGPVQIERDRMVLGSD